MDFLEFYFHRIKEVWALWSVHAFQTQHKTREAMCALAQGRVFTEHV